MIETSRVGAGKISRQEPLWAYAYQLLPPRAAGHMTPVLALVDQENAAALRKARKWTARVLLEDQVTHVLVLSDSPDLDRDTNRRLETMLRELEVRYSVTLPMRIDDPAPAPAAR